MFSIKQWFTTEKIDNDTYVISEYGHREETHCYLLNGTKRSLLIDTGLGICNIFNEVSSITDNHITAVSTHIHWDHIGGHKYFDDFYAHKNELEWLKGGFPLSDEAVRLMVGDGCDLPDDCTTSDYKVFQGLPTRVLSDNDVIDIGGRIVSVLHTPGHSPGHMCFWEENRGYLFTGDLVYKGTLFSNYPSTDPELYLKSLERISMLSVKKIFPGHHTLDIGVEIICSMRDELRKLKAEGRLCHGEGTFKYKDWEFRM